MATLGVSHRHGLALGKVDRSSQTRGKPACVDDGVSDKAVALLLQSHRNGQQPDP